MLMPHRRHALFVFFVLHRVSGLLLALFLPVHFTVLSLAVTDRAALDGFLAFTDNALVKLAEMGLVFLLSVHFLGGLRLLALEFLPWRDWQKTLAAAAAAVSAFVALGFLLSAGM